MRWAAVSIKKVNVLNFFQNIWYVVSNMGFSKKGGGGTIIITTFRKKEWSSKVCPRKHNEGMELRLESSDPKVVSGGLIVSQYIHARKVTKFLIADNVPEWSLTGALKTQTKSPSIILFMLPSVICSAKRDVYSLSK